MPYGITQCYLPPGRDVNPVIMIKALIMITALVLLNRVPASAGGKGGIHISTGWQVTLCDPIWYVSFP